MLEYIARQEGGGCASLNGELSRGKTRRKQPRDKRPRHFSASWGPLMALLTIDIALYRIEGS